MDGDGLADTPDGLADGLALRVFTDGLTVALSDTLLLPVFDGVALATPDKSINTDDIAGIGTLLYLFPDPIAHTTFVTPSNTMLASFTSPLFAYRLHIITLLDPV